MDVPVRAPLVPIGYMAKAVVERPPWLKAPDVLDVCSVSNCISPPPESWTQPSTAGRLNAWGLFDDPDAAWSLVSFSAPHTYDLFGYELFPARYVGGKPEGLRATPSGALPPRAGFEPLGFDVVSRSLGDSFDCSPLSCNGWADEVGANEHCLVSDLEGALGLAAVAESSGCEPGDYYVVRVWRRRREP